MSYKLFFLRSAQKEWEKLNPSLREQFKKKLKERLDNPHVPKDKLREYEFCYKIKLRSSGYRLVYKVIDHRVVVQVIAIAKRDKDEIYKLVRNRLMN